MRRTCQGAAVVGRQGSVSVYLGCCEWGGIVEEEAKAGVRLV